VWRVLLHKIIQYHLMAKTKYQEAATEYAKNYLDTLLELEDYLGRNVEKKIDKIVDEKVRLILVNKNIKNN